LQVEHEDFLRPEKYEFLLKANQKGSKRVYECLELTQQNSEKDNVTRLMQDMRK
jgi:hypothetical protein